MESDNPIVVTAPSVDEAVIIGLTRLTLTRDEVDIEVLDEGSRGFLGIGAREARVRLTPRRRDVEKAPPIAVEPASQQPQVTPPEEVREEPPVVEVEREVGAEPQKIEEAPVPEETSVTPQKEAQTPPAVVETVREQPATPPQSAEVRRPPVARPARPAAAEGLDRQRLEKIATDITDNLLAGLSVETSLEWVEEDRPTLWISIGGRDADSLVGPRARNLHSVQYLVRALIYRQYDGNYNVVVDADGYRRRRRRSLESLAQGKADRAVELGRTVRLRPMPAHERRIVHIVLRQDERVKTESVGKGRERAVTIIPNTPSKPAA